MTVYRLTAEALEKGVDWDTAIDSGMIEPIAKFDHYDDACYYVEDVVGDPNWEIHALA